MDHRTPVSSRFKRLTESQIRELTEGEIEAVFGGDGYGGTVVVVGNNPTTYDPTWSLPPGGTGAGSNGGSGGSTGSSYETSSATQDGNKFADSHLRNHVGQSGEHDFQLAHDVLAKLYDKSIANPNAQVKMGDGTYVTAQQAVASLKSLSFDITNVGCGPNGAVTLYYGHKSDGNQMVTIGINVNNSNVQNVAKNYGDSGINYVIMHELGHAMNDILREDGSESSADTTSVSISQVTGIPQLFH